MRASNTPSGTRIKRIQAKDQTVDTLQAKFDNIVCKAEIKLLEAAIDHLCSKEKYNQDSVSANSVDIEGTHNGSVSFEIMIFWKIKAAASMLLL